MIIKIAQRYWESTLVPVLTFTPETAAERFQIDALSREMDRDKVLNYDAVACGQITIPLIVE